jgi:hypothetical protein
MMPAMGKLARNAYGKIARNADGSMPSETVRNVLLLNAARILFYGLPRGAAGRQKKSLYNM